MAGARRVGADHQGVPLLSDEPISDPSEDYFGFGTFAGALTQIIDNDETDTPLTIALSAPWGAGKTSVAQMTQGMLKERVESRDEERPRIVCTFNAWDHDDAPHLGAALAAQVARTANRHRPRWRRLVWPLPGAMLSPQKRWRRIVKIAAMVALVSLGLVLFHATRKAAESVLHLDASVVSGLGWFGVAVVAAVLWTFLFGVAKDTANFIDEPSSEAAKGSMATVKDQLGDLIKHAIGDGRMVIIVDDLERCSASRAVEVFEVAGQLLAHHGVVTVLLADMSSLEKAATEAYGAKGSSGEEFGRQYLEKLVQLQLELPPPQSKDMVRLLRGEPPATPALSRSERSTRVGWSGVQEFSAYVAVTAAAFSLLVLGIRLTEGGASGNAALTVIGGATSVLGTLVVTVSTWVRSRQRQQRHEVQVRVTSELKKVGARVTVDQAVAASTGGDEKLVPAAEERAEDFLTVQSEELKRVEAVIDAYPPLFPRSAKRMINHARLLTNIARARGMFGGTPELSPEHLGKWIVLRERWHGLAERIAAERHDIAGDGWLSTLTDEATAKDPELSRLLKSKPELTEMIERLVYFEPASLYVAEPDGPKEPDRHPDGDGQVLA